MANSSFNSTQASLQQTQGASLPTSLGQQQQQGEPWRSVAFDFIVSCMSGIQRTAVPLYCHRELERERWHPDEQKPDVLCSLMHGVLGMNKDSMTKVHWIWAETCVQFLATRVFIARVPARAVRRPAESRDLRRAPGGTPACSPASPIPGALLGGSADGLVQTKTAVGVCCALTLFRRGTGSLPSGSLKTSPAVTARDLSMSLSALGVQRCQSARSRPGISALSETHSQFDDDDPLADIAGGPQFGRTHSSGYAPAAAFSDEGDPENFEGRLQLLETGFAYIECLLRDSAAAVDLAIQHFAAQGNISVRPDSKFLSLQKDALRASPEVRRCACRLRDGVTALLQPARRFAPAWRPAPEVAVWGMSERGSLVAPPRATEALRMLLDGDSDGQQGATLARLVTACLQLHHGWLECAAAEPGGLLPPRPKAAAPGRGRHCRVLISAAQEVTVDALITLAAFYLRCPAVEHSEDPLESTGFPPPRSEGDSPRAPPLRLGYTAGSSPRRAPQPLRSHTGEGDAEAAFRAAVAALAPGRALRLLLAAAATPGPCAVAETLAAARAAAALPQPPQTLLLVAPDGAPLIEGRYELCRKRVNNMPLWRMQLAAPTAPAPAPAGGGGGGGYLGGGYHGGSNFGAGFGGGYGSAPPPQQRRPPGHSWWLYFAADRRWWVRSADPQSHLGEARGWMCSPPLPSGALLLPDSAAFAGRWERFTDEGFRGDRAAGVVAASAEGSGAAEQGLRRRAILRVSVYAAAASAACASGLMLLRPSLPRTGPPLRARLRACDALFAARLQLHASVQVQFRSPYVITGVVDSDSPADLARALADTPPAAAAAAPPSPTDVVLLDAVTGECYIVPAPAPPQSPRGRCSNGRGLAPSPLPDPVAVRVTHSPAVLHQLLAAHMLLQSGLLPAAEAVQSLVLGTAELYASAVALAEHLGDCDAWTEPSPLAVRELCDMLGVQLADLPLLLSAAAHLRPSGADLAAALLRTVETLL